MKPWYLLHFHTAARGSSTMTATHSVYFSPRRRSHASRRGAATAATLLPALLVLCLSAAPVRAQMPALNVTARAGLGIPSDEYQSNCGHISAAYSVELQGRGRVFPQVSLDHFAGSGGVDKACVPVDPSVGTARGGLRVEGATRIGAGVGARIGGPRVQLEGLLSGGVVSGRYGFSTLGAADGRTTVPHVGGQVALVLYRYLVLSAAAHWTRLSLDVTPSAGGAVTTQRSWSPMSTLQVGARLPLGRQ